MKRSRQERRKKEEDEGSKKDLLRQTSDLALEDDDGPLCVDIFHSLDILLDGINLQLRISRVEHKDLLRGVVLLLEQHHKTLTAKAKD